MLVLLVFTDFTVFKMLHNLKLVQYWYQNVHACTFGIGKYYIF